jgi:hypothetical protein
MQLLQPVCHILRPSLPAIPNNFRVELTDVDEFIAVLLLIHLLGAFEDGKLSLHVAANAVKFDEIVF